LHRLEKTTQIRQYQKYLDKKIHTEAINIIHLRYLIYGIDKREEFQNDSLLNSTILQNRLHEGQIKESTVM